MADGVVADVVVADGGVSDDGVVVLHSSNNQQRDVLTKV